MSAKFTPAALEKTSGDGGKKRPAGEQGGSWSEFTRIFRDPVQSLGATWASLFGPLRTGQVDDLVVIAQLGQSLDGRIATASGHSKYINGPAGLAHLHRLRSLVDAVVVGVGTALADDPQLTVRHVEGPNPARVVIDPKGRLPGSARVLADDGARRIVITSNGVTSAAASKAEHLSLPASNGRIAPAAILAELAKRGIRRILVEGGAETVSRFFATGCLDRLHMIVAPIILGDGRPSFVLPSLERADQAERLQVRAHEIDNEVVFDCDLSPHRVPIGRAKKSR